MMYVSQINMYTLNLYNAVCQLYLKEKNWNKKKKVCLCNHKELLDIESTTSPHTG